MRIGAWYSKDRGTEFCVWAPARRQVEVILMSAPDRPIALTRDASGYWTGVVREAVPGTLYRYRLDGLQQRPDPASQCQPRGVHESSCVVDHAAFRWTDAEWKGIPLESMVMYEIHIGTFSDKGTFDAVIPRLRELRDLGVTAIELMPVGQFPGDRNWGYDGVYPYAVQSSYGGAEGLKLLVNEVHATGMAVILDVVYNHLGPEGNYHWDYGPYFTDRYRTPWGPAMNFDGPDSDHVREYFLQNALLWFREYHIDALRVDAVHAIYDRSASPFLMELSRATEALVTASGRRHFLIAESNLNDSVVIRPREQFGYGFDAQWSDDLHHALHVILTGEHEGYYVDFGKPEQLRQCLQRGAVFAGEYSQFRRRRHGNSPDGRPARQFVVFSQNHDQIGNRMRGERLSAVVSFEAQKLAAAVVLLSPYVPLLFMGEEYAETAPFPFFVSHGDPDLVEAVRRGRREEFRTFTWAGEPPDPQDPATFASAVLRWERRTQQQHGRMLAFYRELLRLRREVPALALLEKTHTSVEWAEEERVLRMQRWADGSHVMVLFHLRDGKTEVAAPPGSWSVRLSSNEARWGGPESELAAEIGPGRPLPLSGYQMILLERT
jgi:maltooligosyltrehalose trehalohydrolase